MIYSRDAQLYLFTLFPSDTFLFSNNLTKLAICIFACVSVGFKESCFLEMNRNKNGNAVVMIKSARLNKVQLWFLFP